MARRKDDDGRLPIHWASSSNRPEIVQLLSQQKGFDPDIEVRGLNPDCVSMLSTYAQIGRRRLDTIDDRSKC